MCIYLKQFVGVTKHISYEGDMRGEFRILAGIRGGVIRNKVKINEKTNNFSLIFRYYSKCFFLTEMPLCKACCIHIHICILQICLRLRNSNSDWLTETDSKSRETEWRMHILAKRQIDSYSTECSLNIVFFSKNSPKFASPSPALGCYWLFKKLPANRSDCTLALHWKLWRSLTARRCRRWRGCTELDKKKAAIGCSKITSQ